MKNSHYTLEVITAEDDYALKQKWAQRMRDK